MPEWLKPAPGPISSGFGKRVAPTPGASTFHAGADIGASNGSPVIASASGVVAFAGLGGGFGGLVRIDHAGPDETYYAHLSYIGVRYGQQVVQGQVIGASGGRPGQWGAGTSNGSHLHFEHRINGVAVDPVPYWSSTADSNSNPIGDDDVLTPDQENKLNAVYAALWNGGSNTVDGVPMKYNYGVLHMEYANQVLIARTVTETAALSAAVKALAAGVGIDPETLTALIAEKVDAALADNFASVKAAIPTEFTITAKS